MTASVVGWFSHPESLVLPPPQIHSLLMSSKYILKEKKQESAVQRTEEQEQNTLVLVCKLAPIHKGQGETEEEAGHSGLVGGRFKHENL